MSLHRYMCRSCTVFYLSKIIHEWLYMYYHYCCRTCLRYFLPPNWIMDKDAISTMALPELAAFPLDDFFDHYEKGLRKVSTNQLSNNKYSWTLEAWTQMARTLWISWPVVLVPSILPLIPCQINPDFSNFNFSKSNYFYGPVVTNQYKLIFQARTPCGSI